MKVISGSLRVSIPLCLGLTAAAGPSATPPMTAAQLDQHNVIVIMRDQLAAVPPARDAMDARTAAISDSQSSLVARLQQTRARTVTSFKTINAFATSVSSAEAATLSTQPGVQAVVPDAVIHLAPRAHAEHRASVASESSAAGAASTTSAASGLCGTLEPEALQLMNAAFLDPAVPQAQHVLDGNGKPITGAGVKVAFLADGIDPTVAGFVRPDGTSVFIDYQDFSGDPAGTPTDGGEAFGDASSIAAQDMPNGTLLTYDISQFVNAAHPLPSPCNIHIRGVAPGAALVGLKVFSAINGTTNSQFVQAIEYAVVHDHVDVINESFGANPYPDENTDPISLANHAAVDAGVTVVASSGDSGQGSTMGTPSTDSYVISAGASTQFRFYAQTGDGAQALAHGYVSNNISALSSTGVAQRAPQTLDVIAPGDLSWALCSTNPALFQACTNYQSPAGPTPIESFGGTSESSPLTAGTAALVIQAYRSTHGGKNPSPALVKRIIMSSAKDLGATAVEQGAGLVNALDAVYAALAVDAKPKGSGVLLTTNSIGVTAEPNTHESQTLSITNTGTQARHLNAALQTLGAPIAGATTTLELGPSDPTFPNVTGAARAYVKQKFTVPAGADHLDASIAWQVSLSAALYTAATPPIAYLALLDPSGRQVAYSLPQGFGSGYAHVDVVKPAGGTWTAVVWVRPSGAGAYAGPIQLTWGAENYVSAGSVYPATLDLAPGATRSITASFFTPMQAGNSSAAVRFTDAASAGASLPEIPVVMRTLVPTSSVGGSFTGTLTGGNGRSGGAGPSQVFEFYVPAGAPDLSLAMDMADNGYLLYGFLVDPNGMALSSVANIDPFGNPEYGLQLSHYNPQPGLWKFVVFQFYFSSGNQTTLPFTARIGFNPSPITATDLPNDPKTTVSASKGATATINVTNTGVVTEAFFADARLTTLAATSLPLYACASTTPVATLPGACGEFWLPPESSAVAFIAKSPVPIEMDAANDVGGTPDIFAQKTGPTTVTAFLSKPELPYGPYQEYPTEIGPFGPAGELTASVTQSAVALTKEFDGGVSASSGNAWADLVQGTSTYNPLLLASGDSGAITLTIKPEASQVGKTISGYVYVDTYNSFAGSGDEVVRIPYSYTVAP